MDWVSLQYGAQLNGGTSVCNWVVLPSELADIFTDPTLMASRAVFSARTSGVQFNLQGNIGYGLIEWSSVDDALPNPCPDVFIDGDFDWIQRIVFGAPQNSDAGSLFTTILDEQYMSKAKRRLETNNSLLAVVSNDTGAFITTTLDLRCLIKE
jgi:outer membrane receptor protein involved in Fe transport